MSTREQDTQRILELSNELARKLADYRVLNPESNGNVAHHLAEVCISGKRIHDELVPRLLRTGVDESDSLAELSHELLSELEEMRDGIDEMLSDVTALMNALNR